MDSTITRVPRKCACIVPGCNDKHSVRRRFPKRTDGHIIYNTWLKQVNNPKLFTMPKKKVCESYCVCDRHFDEDCKIPNYKRLKPGSIPTLFLPSISDTEERTEAVYNVIDTTIDLPAPPTDSLDTSLVNCEELFLNSDAFELHTVEAQDSFLSSIFKSKEPQYDEPQFPVRLPEDESALNDTTNTDNADNTDNAENTELEELEEFLYFEEVIDTGSSDIIKIEIGDFKEDEESEEAEETVETEEVGEVEPALPEKPYFKSVKSYLVDSRSITEVCRICFRSILDEEMIKLYEDMEDAINIKNMLKLILPDLDLEMYPNSVVCARCHELLICSYHLKETWLTTEEKLQKIINKKIGVTNRDADLVIVAKAIRKEENSKDKNGTKENDVGIIVTKPVNKPMQEILIHEDSTTNLDVSDHVSLDIETFPQKSGTKNVNGQNSPGKKRNDVGIKPAKVTNKVVQDKLNQSDSTTNIEVSHDIADQNICNKRKLGLEQQNIGDDKLLADVKRKLLDILGRNDSTTNLGVSDDLGDLDTEKTNQNVLSKKILVLGQENDVEIEPAEVTDEVVQDIISHSDITTNLEVVIYHGDTDFEKPPKQPKPINNNNNTNVRSKGIWGLGPYMCEVCGNTIPELKALKRHLQRHREAKNRKPRTKQEKDIMCELCGQLFSNNRALSKHTEKHGRKLDCTICHKVFGYNKSLQLHIQRRHLRQYDYSQCHLCGKQLAYKKSLAMHLLTHNAEKQHVCNICDKRFIFPGSLKKHLLKHTSDMLSCEYCGKALKYQHSLQKHIRIYHKNEAEFRCDFCSRPYWKRVDLIKHKIRVHAWAPEPETT